MIGKLRTDLRDRLIALDPGYIGFRGALSVVLSLTLAVLVLLPFGLPLTTVMVGAIGAMLSAFGVNDPQPRDQAITLALGAVTGSVSLTVASLGNAMNPLNSIVFVLLIFVAVYAQRFGPRGTALGSVGFFLFFFAMFLRTGLPDVPLLLAAFATGVSSNAVVRFLLLRRRPERELLHLRVTFRARLGAVVKAAAAYLAAGGADQDPKTLRRAHDRMHDCVLLIDDVAGDVMDPRSAVLLRRRAIEVELAVQALSGTVWRTAIRPLAPAVRRALVRDLYRLHSLIERDPRETPVISETGEFTRLLLEGSRLDEQPSPGDDVRRAIAELAVADVNAQRIAEHGASDEDLDEPEPHAGTTETEQPGKVFTYDNQTRGALQAVVGGGLAVLGGELVSPQRWYWAVLTVFVVFVGSSSTGATFVKGARRLGGTLVGLFGGFLAALLVAGNPPATLVLLALCVFGMAYTARLSQVVMAFFITTMLGLLYSLLGMFSYEVLWIRLAETAVGAVAGVLAAVLIVPVRTRSVIRDQVADALDELRGFVEQSAKLLTGEENVNVVQLARDVDRAVAQVRKTIEPLTHPINLNSARRTYGWYVLSGLETITHQVRHIAARAQPGLLAGDEKFPARVEGLLGNIDLVLSVLRSPTATARRLTAPNATADGNPRHRSFLTGVDQLDAAVTALGKAFGLKR